jgi:predicted nucleic acid-binding protein
LLSARDHYHDWAKQVFGSVSPPLLTCEPVLTEAWYLLRGSPQGQAALLELVVREIVAPEFRLTEELAAIRRLATRYRDRPVSLADLCLVRMSELHDGAKVITADHDFVVYRKHGRQVIELVAPFG